MEGRNDQLYHASLLASQVNGGGHVRLILRFGAAVLAAFIVFFGTRLILETALTMDRETAQTLAGLAAGLVPLAQLTATVSSPRLIRTRRYRYPGALVAGKRKMASFIRRPTGGHRLIERDRELEQCSAMLEATVGGHGGVLLVKGPAGIGKTSLLEDMLELKEARGLVALQARGSEREKEIPFGVARQLFRQYLRREDSRQRQLFSGGAELSAIALGIEGTELGDGVDLVAMEDALYWLVVNTCESNHLVIVVDDAHWADEQSLRWLRYLSARISTVPTLLVCTYREDPTPANKILVDIELLPAAQVLRLRELSQEASSRLVRDVFGSRTSDSLCEAIFKATRGNPFGLTELVQSVRLEGVPLTVEAFADLPSLVSERVSQSVNRRLDHLGHSAHALARAVVVLGPQSNLRHAERIALLARDEAREQVNYLSQAEIFSQGPELSFIHPLTEAAVRQGMPVNTRSEMHMRAAQLLSENGEPPEVLASHLMYTIANGDEWVVATLRAAADRASATGAPETAARYLARALVEPPPSRLVARVHYEYGRALSLSQPNKAIEYLKTSYHKTNDDEIRALAVIALAKAYSHAGKMGQSVYALEEALDRFPDGPQRRRVQLEHLLWAIYWADDLRRLERSQFLDQFRQTLTGKDPTERGLLALYALTLTLQGKPRTDVLATARPIIDGGITFLDKRQGFEISMNLAQIAMFADELALARRLFDQAVDELDRAGWRGTHLSFAYSYRAQVALREGRLLDAEADAAIALRLADRIESETQQVTPATWYALGPNIQALIARGRPSAAASLAKARGYGQAEPSALTIPMPRAVYGQMCLAVGRQSEAIAVLSEVGQWLDERAITNPSWCPWRNDLALALADRDSSEAMTVAEKSRQQAELFGCPSARGRALRTLARLSHNADGLPLLEQSTEILRTSQSRLEYAKSLYYLGIILRRLGRSRDSLKYLRESLATADNCGAERLVSKIRFLLVRSGQSIQKNRLPRYILTAEQLRAVRLAAEGLSDAEIAHRMVLGLDTVNDLVTQSCRALGQSNRSELRKIMGGLLSQ